MNLTFEPLNELHFPLLLKWLEIPHVKAVWDTDIQWTEKLIQDKFDYVDGESVHAFIIQCNGVNIGYIQYYEASTSMAGLDFYIGEPDYLGKSLGSKVLKQFLSDHVFQQFDACLVDPDKNNKYAIKTYIEAGFANHSESGQSIIMINRKGTPIRISQKYDDYHIEYQEEPVPEDDFGS